MTVAQLIEQLQGFDPTAKVHLAYVSGDYWHTEVAPVVRRVEEATVAFSEYHRMPAIAEEAGEDESESVVVIR